MGKTNIGWGVYFGRSADQMSVTQNISITPLVTRKKILAKAILSISGWRKIFSSDGEANSMHSKISPQNLEFVLVVAEILAEYFLSQGYRFLLLGRDSRPTGENIQQILYLILSKTPITCYWSTTTALPQVMAYCKQAKEKTGFIYITASHNPAGYNGFKIGDHEGKVLWEKTITCLIEKFKQHYLNDEHLMLTLQKYLLADKKPLNIMPLDSQESYHQLTKRVITGDGGDDSMNNRILLSLKQAVSTYEPVIVYDFNGSARIGSIDLDILQEFGVTSKTIGEEMGHFNHGIVPEGDNLKLLRETLLKFQNLKSLFGLAVDLDGDRGNLVLWNRDNQIFTPDAQSIFMISVIAQLAFLSLFYPQQLTKAAVVANGPTSQRIANICQLFKVSFFQAEVGEANVLALAQNLKDQGYSTAILGEGSNGGNIIPPSTVRDPLNTVFSALKLLFLKHKKSGKSLLDVVREKFNVGKNIVNNDPRYALYEIIDCMSAYQTTPSFSSEGIMHVHSRDAKRLKKEYEKLFTDAFNQNKSPLFKNLGVQGYEVVNYEGIYCRIGRGNRTGAEDGGFKIRLMRVKKGEKKEIAFIWFRGSKTEPVFRVMVDIKGTAKQHDVLLAWHKKLIAEADMHSR